MGRAHEVRAASMAKTAAAKSKLNAKWGRAIYVAAKSGDPNPEMNQTLKKTIEQAKREQCTADVIKRAIEKAKGGTGESYTFERYEGMGPANSWWIVDCLTDNHNRTLTAMRTAFQKVGGSLTSVLYNFSNKAVLAFDGDDADSIMELLLENDCDIEDVQAEEGVVTVFAPKGEYEHVREVLVSNNPEINFLEDHVTWVPSTYVKLTEEHDKNKYDRLQAMLDECDDVQDIYNNIEFDD